MGDFLKWDSTIYTTCYIHNGYVICHVPYHPNCNSKGYVPKSRLVMENHLGRYLDKNEKIKRLDNNRLNDLIENLKVLPPVFYSWEDFPDDDWKSIEGYPDYLITSYGKVKNKKNGDILRGERHESGYIIFNLSSEGVTRKERAHRLVAKTFLDNPENLKQVNHKNGIKDDNRVDNLEWCTQFQNLEHAYNTGLMAYTKKHLVSDEDVIKIKLLYKTGNYTYKDLAIIFDTSYSNIGRIIRGESRKVIVE